MKQQLFKLRSILILFFGAIFIGGLASMQLATAATNTLALPKVYLQPLTQTLALNATLSVPVRVDTAGQQANLASVSITYPSSILQFVSVSYSGSAFGGAVQEDVSTPGTIKISRYATPAGETVSGDLLFATLTFKVKAVGVGDLNLDNTVSELLNGGIGISISLVGINIDVTTKPTPGPTPTPPSTPTTPTTPGSGSTTNNSSSNKTGGSGTSTTKPTTAASTTTAPKKGSRLKKILGLVGIGLGVLGVGGGLTYLLLGKKYGWFGAKAGSALAGGVAGGGLAAGSLAANDDDQSVSGGDLTPPTSSGSDVTGNGPVVITPNGNDDKPNQQL